MVDTLTWFDESVALFEVDETEIVARVVVALFAFVNPSETTVVVTTVDSFTVRLSTVEKPTLLDSDTTAAETFDDVAVTVETSSMLGECGVDVTLTVVAEDLVEAIEGCVDIGAVLATAVAAVET